MGEIVLIDNALSPAHIRVCGSNPSHVIDEPTSLRPVVTMESESERRWMAATLNFPTLPAYKHIR